MHSIKKRILSLTAAALSVVGMASGAMAIESNKDARPIMTQIDVTGYNANVDYTAEMLKCIEDGSDYAMEMGAIYEAQRNLKIEDMALDYDFTYYFTTYETADEIKQAMEAANAEEEKASYTEEDLYWLSRVVYAEAGCSWFPDWVQRDVASVVLNRVNDPRYPDTIKDVIFDPYQYSCVDNGSIYSTPTQQCIDNARYVLENGSTLPSSVIGQSAYAWGPVYKSYYDSILGTTIKFFSC